MNTYYSLRYLASELNAMLSEAVFAQAVTSRKNEIGLFFSGPEQELKIMVSTDPQRTAVFTDPRVSVKKSNSASFFSSLAGYTVKKIHIAESDRFIFIRFQDSEIFLTLKMFGNDPNIFLTDGDKIIEAFKNPSRYTGANLPLPQSLKAPLLSEAKGGFKRKVQQAWPQLPRVFLDELIAFHKLDELPPDQADELLSSIHLQLTHSPEPRILHDGRFSLFSAANFPVDGAETFTDINTAVRVAFFSERRENVFAKELLLLQKRIEKLRARYESALQDADNARKSIEKAEFYEQTGNILMAHAHEALPASEEIELEDFYQAGTKRRIKLDPRLGIAGNAARYFELRKKAERAFETAAEYAEMIEGRFSQLREIEEKLQHVTDLRALDALKAEYSSHELFRKKQLPGAESVRPYKFGRIGKYEVWIGKNAKSNDLIMRDSHKEDIWMHAKGVAGSHVIIRMNRAQTEPDVSQLEKAAGWAAWFSKAKGSAFTPVIKTRRKFVRKQKQGPAGAVLIDREEVLIVPPVQPRADELED